MPITSQSQTQLVSHWVIHANRKPTTTSAGTKNSQRRPRALHEPSNTVVKHMCCEEAPLLTFPDLGFDSTKELQHMVGTPCHLQASPGTPTNNHCKSTPHPPVLDLSRTLTNHKPHKVAHWVLNASHKPITNSAGVTLGTKCQSQANH